MFPLSPGPCSSFIFYVALTFQSPTPLRMMDVLGRDLLRRYRLVYDLWRHNSSGVGEAAILFRFLSALKRVTNLFVECKSEVFSTGEQETQLLVRGTHSLDFVVSITIPSLLKQCGGVVRRIGWEPNQVRCWLFWVRGTACEVKSSTSPRLVILLIHFKSCVPAI